MKHGPLEDFTKPGDELHFHGNVGMSEQLPYQSPLEDCQALAAPSRAGGAEPV